MKLKRPKNGAIFWATLYSRKDFITYVGLLRSVQQHGIINLLIKPAQ